MIAPLHEFVNLLEETQVLDADHFTLVQSELRSRCDDAKTLAKELLEIWHARA